MTIISMTDPILAGNPGATGVGPFPPGPDPPNPGSWFDRGGPYGPYGPAPGGPEDHAIADMKMAARTDDHVDGAMTWMLCDGRAINRATYAGLFAVINVLYGIGDGATTFNIPNFAVDPVPGAPQGRFPVGASGGGGYALGAIAGAETHLHGMIVWATAMIHTYNPFQIVQGLPFAPATAAAGVLAIDVLHDHMMPNITHGLGPYFTDFMPAPAINPYTAVGFFIRVR